MNRTIPLSAALAAAALLSACATTPVPLQGQFSALTPADASKSEVHGERVRWGGEIISVQPKRDVTCFELLDRDLDATGRPIRRDKSDGRFMACRSGFYDPAVFTAGRELTIVGQLNGTETGRVGEFDYVYPRVAADAVYLWPKRVAYPGGPYPYPGGYYDPFYDPFFYGFGPWWSAPIVVVHGGGHHHH